MESDHQEQDLTDAKLQNEIHRNEIGKHSVFYYFCQWHKGIFIEQKIKLEELKHRQELAKYIIYCM